MERGSAVSDNKAANQRSKKLFSDCSWRFLFVSPKAKLSMSRARRCYVFITNLNRYTAALSHFILRDASEFSLTHSVLIEVLVDQEHTVSSAFSTNTQTNDY